MFQLTVRPWGNLPTVTFEADKPRQVFVPDLPFEASEAKVREALAKFGTVCCDVIRSFINLRSRRSGCTTLVASVSLKMLIYGPSIPCHNNPDGQQP